MRWRLGADCAASQKLAPYECSRQIVGLSFRLVAGVCDVGGFQSDAATGIPLAENIPKTETDNGKTPERAAGRNQRMSDGKTARGL
jgi:hypothetical protein